MRHVPGTKHSAADGLSRRPYSPAEKEEGASEHNAELYSISVCPIAAEEGTDIEVLDSSYSEHSQRIARYHTTMARHSGVSSGKEFRLSKR